MSDLTNPSSGPADPSDEKRDGSAEHQARGEASMDDQVASEVEAAMAAMDANDLADLTGVTQPQAEQDVAPGNRCTGTIAAIYGEDVFIDLGGKTQAIAPRSQFGKEEVLEVGRRVEVLVDRFDEDSGCMLVSRDGAVREARWESMKVGDIVEGVINGMNKGGLEMNLKGIRAFMPASQVDLGHVKDISVFLGQKCKVQIIELSRKNRNVLVSRRKVQEREQLESKERLMTELAEGQLRKGVVGNITDFGAFVNLGGVDGLIHISDLSYKQVRKVTDVLSQGQEVEVKVLKVDRDRERISLGLKQVQPDPWANVENNYPVGSEVTVRVLRLEKFGAFVELEEGVEGLIPISEMSWTRIGRPSEVVEKNQTVKAVVIRVDDRERKIALSIKQAKEDPWAGVPESFPKNTNHKGKVTKCEKFGAFVELAPGIEGLVHISELSDQRVRATEDVVNPGDEVEVRVLDVDPDSRRISLSVKAAQHGTEDAAAVAEAAAPSKKKKRKKPLRGGLTSHFDWLGQSPTDTP